MQIKDELLNPYEISFDGIQYTLLENRTTDKGKTYQETHGYFTDLTFAVKKICQLEISKKDSLSLQEFLNEWKKLMVKFKPLFYEN